MTDVDVFAEMYARHRGALVRLAALLLDDASLAEDAVQEAYVSCHRRVLRDPSSALPYLRQAVVNQARSTLRRRLLAARHATVTAPDVPSAESTAYTALSRDALITALRGLPRRQREAVVLKHYVGMTETEVAIVMDVSVGAVKAYASRGIAALAARMDDPR